jgi:membrane protein DedA with SNARE-associated domain
VKNFPVQSSNKRKFTEKTPRILVTVIIVAILVVIIAILLIETLEDTLVVGGSFSGTPIAVLLNGIVSLTQNTTAAIQSWGYIGIFALMALESSSLPIPSEVVLPFAGYLVSQGLLDFWLTILVSTVAAILGSLIDYYIGLKGTNVLAKRKSINNLLYGGGRMETVERWFKKYGAVTVFLSRLVPGFRTIISFPAGAVKMSLPKFIAYTTVGCLLWNILLTYVGIYVGANWREVAGLVHYVIIAVAVTLLIALALFLIKRRRNLAQRRGMAESI